MGHVVNVVGGVEEINLYFGDAAQRFHPLSADYQRKATAFLVEHALQTPALFTGTNLVLRLTSQGVADRLLGAQKQVITGLINARRIGRMVENERILGTTSYRIQELFDSIRRGLFSELEQPTPQIDAYRRNLQRSYVEHLASEIKDPASDSDLPSYARAELIAIRELLSRAKGREGSATHLQDLAARIDIALDPALGRKPR